MVFSGTYTRVASPGVTRASNAGRTIGTAVVLSIVNPITATNQETIVTSAIRMFHILWEEHGVKAAYWSWLLWILAILLLLLLLHQLWRGFNWDHQQHYLLRRRRIMIINFHSLSRFDLFIYLFVIIKMDDPPVDMCTIWTRKRDLIRILMALIIKSKLMWVFVLLVCVWLWDHDHHNV